MNSNNDKKPPDQFYLTPTVEALLEEGNRGLRTLSRRIRKVAVAENPNPIELEALGLTGVAEDLPGETFSESGSPDDPAIFKGLYPRPGAPKRLNQHFLYQAPGYREGDEYTPPNGDAFTGKRVEAYFISYAELEIMKQHIEELFHSIYNKRLIFLFPAVGTKEWEIIGLVQEYARKVPGLPEEEVAKCPLSVDAFDTSAVYLEQLRAAGRELTSNIRTHEVDVLSQEFLDHPLWQEDPLARRTFFDLGCTRYNRSFLEIATSYHDLGRILRPGDKAYVGANLTQRRRPNLDAYSHFEGYFLNAMRMTIIASGVKRAPENPFPFAYARRVEYNLETLPGDMRRFRITRIPRNVQALRRLHLEHPARPELSIDFEEGEETIGNLSTIVSMRGHKAMLRQAGIKMTTWRHENEAIPDADFRLLCVEKNPRLRERPTINALS